ncbi:short-chain fatty acids transporter [Tenacibaculum sp. MAR_2009_124]|uniref:short-chain fatty acid transporter n=1 Tax=Tenacibaculum sp. MAR_2009_124 TaxID=1250059 RepID=UPI00089551A5|nr:TIGR00366 family protein [Tenacibaculum sp. MAR_2009_124]SEC81989.1 short-chain fatty acids transporter [Tenacibaculum sp. MAR_2009_124]
MKITQLIEKAFKKYLPSPFTIAILLTLITFVLGIFFTKPENSTLSTYSLEVLSFWEKGIWTNGLLVFAYQMMLILVLGHVLVLSKPVSNLILHVTKYCTNTATSAAVVSCTTMLVAFFNWGLGLIFGALLARKVAEYAQSKNIPLNYPIIGAAGYVGLMVWHGGISGSAPIKINEPGHIKSIMKSVSSEQVLKQIPELISYSETVFSWWNLLTFLLVLVGVTLTFYFLGKKSKATLINLPEYKFSKELKGTTHAEKLDNSKWLAYVFGLLILVAFIYRYTEDMIALKITPNLINFFMLGLGIILHGSFKNFTNAVGESISDVSGILIQFPLYFGIMGIMKSTGMVTLISGFFVSVSTATTLPIFTFFSAGLVNVFVPSGGGQWVVQGPIVVESALQLGVPLPKAIMAMAYGDQVTNMLQPFWALPLLGITKLKAREILPYTLVAMVVGSAIYVLGLLIF